MDTLKTLLDSGKLKTSYIIVKVVKQLGSDLFIVADKSKVAILDTTDSPGYGKFLGNGFWYKLIKCNKGKDENTVNINKIFKPVKANKQEEIGDIGKLIKSLEQKMKKQLKKDEYIDFETLEKKENNSKIEELILKVISVSRTITTNRGNYQICTIKDFKGNKTSLNLYQKFLGALEISQIYKVRNLRKGEITKNEEVQMRLHTTSFSKIEAGTAQESILFEGIRSGDAMIEGELIGIGEIKKYQSCKIHFCKVNDESDCPKCMSKLTEKNIIDDFRMDLYVEESGSVENGEATVAEILLFKKTLSSHHSENIEDKVDDLVNKKIRVDYNIDDAGRRIATFVEFIE